MDQPNPIILNVSALDLPNLIIEASDGMKYYVDLSSMSSVYCFPKNNNDWKSVNIDSYGLALTWSTRFEVHIDQLIALAYKSEKYSILAKTG